MKKFMKITRHLLLCLLLSLSCSAMYANASDTDMSDDEFLLQTGMPQEEINQLDSDIKAFMITDMKSSAKESDLSYVPINISDLGNFLPNRVNQVFYDIEFSASAFKSGSTIYIYPTYEFTDYKRPKGNDSFSFQLGSAMVPYEYGGQVWYKDSTMTNWKVGGSMTANTQSSNGAEYSGSQLGSPDWSMKFKGCAYCHADVGTGSDKRIIMSYMYNPNKGNYTLSFSAYGLGISYTSSSTVYTNASTVKLSY
jgi:hypothetical protein